MGFFLTLLLYVGFTLLSELLMPQPDIEGAKPGGLGDFQFPTAEEGRVVPIIWGTVRLNGPNIGWYGDLRTVAIKKKVKTGLFSSKKVTTGHKYYLGIDFLLCRGEFGTSHSQGLRRIWVDDSILRPESEGFTRTGTITLNDEDFFGKDSGGISGTTTLFPGSSSQVQSVYMGNVSDIDSTLLPAYVGTAHLVLEQVYVGKSASLRPWSFELRRIPDGLVLGVDALVNGNDANPANVAYEIMTNVEWGLGLSNIDTVQMSASGVTLAAENNGYARILDRALQASDLLVEIEQQVDGIFVKDAVTKAWQLRLIREEDYPSPVTSLPLFNESNVLSVDFSRGAWADTANQVKIQFTDREKNFQTSFAVAQDMANKIIQNDDDIIATQNYPAVQDRTLANALAWRDLRTLSYPLSKGKIKADRKNYALRPGDLALLTWPPYGIVNLAIRVNKISMGTPEANEMVYDWVQDIFRSELPSFSDPTDSLWNPIDDGPTNVIAARIVEMPLGYQDVNTSQQYGIMAVRANGAQLSYDFYLYEDATLPINTDRNSGAVINSELSPFTPSALLDGAVEISDGDSNYNNDTILINATTDIDLVDIVAVVADLNDPIPPNLIFIDDEIIFFESITSLGGGQYNLINCHRGMLDTAVARHDDNTRVWFFSYGIGVIETALAGSTVGIAGWFMSSSGGGDQGDPNEAPLLSPEQGVVVALETPNTRYLGASAATNVEIDGAAIGGVTTLGDQFTINWFNRLNSFTDRTGTNEGANDTGTGYTYNVRVYHTGVSPEVEVYSATDISAEDNLSSPMGHVVTGYAVPFSPDASPWPSPEPFPQTYRVELEVTDGNSPAIVGQSWVHDFTRG